jgi:predicted RNase H-like HicB family nuclease
MTTYTAVCTRTDNWWAITVPELPGVFSQARRLDQVEAMARDAIAALLDVSPKSFDIEVRPELPGEVTAARRARAKLVEAEQSAEKATVEAAKKLIADGYTVRDAGKLLGISPQRVSQLTAQKKKVRKVTQRGAKPASGSGQRTAA